MLCYKFFQVGVGALSEGGSIPLWDRARTTGIHHLAVFLVMGFSLSEGSFDVSAEICRPCLAPFAMVRTMCHFLI
jgi:hypothetical protein